MKTLIVRIGNGGVPAGLSKLSAKGKNPEPGLLIAGRAVGNLLKAHYRRKDQTGNRLGGQRTHYWQRVGQSVNAPKPEGKNTVVVAISEPTFGHKVTGGTIRAKRAKCLTIPVHPDAHGRRASVLEMTKGIQLFRVKNVLAARGADGQLTVFYALKKSVTQAPDPEALPPEKELMETAQNAFNQWLAAE